MKIGVFGNCQSLGFAASLRALLPSASIERFHAGRVDIDQLGAVARECDLFYAQRRFAGRLEGLAGDRIRYFPLIVFTGFHPDLTWIRGKDGLLRSPFGKLHSALIAACHVLNIPVDRVADLFNAYVFAELGYLGEFERARENLANDDGATGLDLEPMIDAWLADGCFMHTVNHPMMRVLFSIATALVKNEGLSVTNDANPPADNLSRALRWPVHSALADKIDIPASPDFQSRAQKPLTLPEFIAGSYEIYAGLSKSVLLDNPAIARAVSDLGRAGVRMPSRHWKTLAGVDKSVGWGYPAILVGPRERELECVAKGRPMNAKGSMPQNAENSSRKKVSTTKLFADLHEKFDSYSPEEREKMLYQGLQRLSSAVKRINARLAKGAEAGNNEAEEEI